MILLTYEFNKRTVYTAPVATTDFVLKNEVNRRPTNGNPPRDGGSR